MSFKTGFKVLNTRPASPLRFCLATSILLATAAPTAVIWAQSYPVRPIRLIVGFVPGGIVDVIARALSQKLGEGWRQQVIVDNRAGAGGIISMQLVANAVPDGYTLLMGSSTQFSINPALRTGLPYDPIADYTAVTQVALTPHILTVLPSYPARSIKELIQLAKTRPELVMNYASTGYGTAPHIAAELFKRSAGINMTHVPYKGGGDAMVALMGGQVQMSFGAIATALPHIRAGRIRALGITSLKRLQSIPDVPTFVEEGLPDFEIVAWFGVFAPPGQSAALTLKINEALARAMESTELKRHFSEAGIEIVRSSPQEFATYVKAELARWTRVVKETGIGETP